MISLAAVSEQDSGFLHIALAQEDGQDPISSSIIEQLQKEPSLIRYTLCADAKEAAARFAAEGKRFDVIVVDPPRKGCDLATLNAIVEMAPPRLVYVSCNAATLARDLKILEEKGFKTQSATPVDLFPRTHHVESVALLTRSTTI